MVYNDASGSNPYILTYLPGDVNFVNLSYATTANLAYLNDDNRLILKASFQHFNPLS
jgi:hypothetical protein